MRGGSDSLPAQEAEKVTHLPLGVKMDFCPDMMMTSENKKSACLDESNTDAKTRIFGILNKIKPIISTTNFS